MNQTKLLLFKQRKWVNNNKKNNCIKFKKFLMKNLIIMIKFNNKNNNNKLNFKAKIAIKDYKFPKFAISNRFLMIVIVIAIIIKFKEGKIGIKHRAVNNFCKENLKVEIIKGLKKGNLVFIRILIVLMLRFICNNFN